MNVLSLFDGMSCGQIALNRAGIYYNNYFASEIDKYSIIVTQKNYPNTIQLGDVTLLDTKTLPKIDLLIGGSPCQSFSRIGNGLGFDGSSKLFWEYVRVLKETNPTYFLLENVIMKKEWEDTITEALGVLPFKINSSLFVPQSRKRLYWTNIPDITQPEQKDYNIQDFIESISGRTTSGFTTTCKLHKNPRKAEFKRCDIFNTLVATYYKGINGSGRSAISTKEGFLDDDRKAHRMLTPTECERLQTVPINYTNYVAKTNRYKMLGNGWTVDVIAHILKNITL